jgi:hypothetical protein
VQRSRRVCFRSRRGSSNGKTRAVDRDAVERAHSNRTIIVTLATTS